MDETQAIQALDRYLQDKAENTIVGRSLHDTRCPLACALQEVTGKEWHVSYYASWQNDGVPPPDAQHDYEYASSESFAYTNESSIVWHFVREIDGIYPHQHKEITAGQARKALLDATSKAGFTIIDTVAQETGL